MSKDSAIEWTDHTFNPWWGCQRVSPGCENCYAETFAHRLGRDLWGPMAPRKPASENYWGQPRRWNAEAAAAGVRRRVFCASMSDVFEDRRDLDVPRERLWRLIEETPALDWLLLTKRPQNMTRLAPERWARRWPGNVWAGTTTEDQTRLNERWKYLRDVPALVLFLSVEPMLGPVRLPIGISPTWVIAGAESGARPRPMAEDWARSLRDQCASIGVRFFYKQQLGDGRQMVSLPLLDGRQWAEFPAGAS